MAEWHGSMVLIETDVLMWKSAPRNKPPIYHTAAKLRGDVQRKVYLLCKPVCIRNSARTNALDTQPHSPTFRQKTSTLTIITIIVIINCMVMVHEILCAICLLNAYIQTSCLSIYKLLLLRQIYVSKCYCWCIVGVLFLAFANGPNHIRLHCENALNHTIARLMALKATSERIFKAILY